MAAHDSKLILVNLVNYQMNSSCDFFHSRNQCKTYKQNLEEKKIEMLIKDTWNYFVVAATVLKQNLVNLKAKCQMLCVLVTAIFINTKIREVVNDISEVI